MDPVTLLILFIVGPASVSISCILGYIAFLHITRNYAVQAGKNMTDKILDIFERNLPAITEAVVRSGTKTTSPAASNVSEFCDLLDTCTTSTEKGTTFDIAKMMKNLMKPSKEVQTEPTLQHRDPRRRIDVD
jgi:hypothetical protein